MKLIGKVFITGQIETKTGLHVGGSKSALDIGGVDLNVIKTPDGIPFIPGSSIKGKLRSLLAKMEGSLAVSEKDLTEDDKIKRKANNKEIPIDTDFPYMLKIFGSSGDDPNNKGGKVTRLIVRDAFLDTKNFKFDRDNLDFDYTNVKWENTINRIKGTAEHPRQLERVPAGSFFTFEMVYDVYNDNKKMEHLEKIRTAMYVLEHDYIGGSGSRGYGQIVFNNIKFKERKIDNGKYSEKAEEFGFDFRATEKATTETTN